MTVVLKVLAVLLLTLPPSAYVAGRIAGPPELSAYGHAVTTAPTPPQAPEPPRVGPARPDRSPSTSPVEAGPERTLGVQRVEDDAAPADKADQRRGDGRGERTRADGRVTSDADGPRRRPPQRRPEGVGPAERNRPDEPLVARVPEPVEPSPADGSVEVHADLVELPDAVEVLRGDGPGADDVYFDDVPEDGSVVIEGGEPW